MGSGEKLKSQTEMEIEGSQTSVTREQVMEMMKQKDGLEEDIKALHDVLKCQGVGMDEPLVDGEGFPRSDIDVYQVRHARNNIRCKVGIVVQCSLLVA